MTRTWPIWTVFGGAILLVLAVMVWVSSTVFRLDRLQRDMRRSEIEARQTAEWEQNIRLALWRMDTLAAPLVARETARPYFVYRTFLPLNYPYTNMFNSIEMSQRRGTSPLTVDPASFVLLFFQIEPDGRLTSPQVVGDGSHGLQTLSQIEPLWPGREQALLDRLARRIDRTAALERLGRLGASDDIVTSPADWQSGHPGATEQALARPSKTPVAVAPPATQKTPPQAQEQRERQKKLVPPGRKFEYDQREQFAQQQSMVANVQNADLANNLVANTWQQPFLPGLPRYFGQDDLTSLGGVPQQPPQQDALPQPVVASAPAQVNTSIMAPAWFEDDLVLLRRVQIRDQVFIQGCLIDWPSLAGALLESAEDLLPEARLIPIRAGRGPTQGHRMAALPIVLEPGAPPSQPGAGLFSERSFSVLRVSLTVAWCCVLAAVLAVGLLVGGVIRLGRRRTAFVTAVTHELRTPLTTFQMYAEMLAEGMVDGDDQRHVYFQTLRAESARLTHMVENVLAYARLKRGRGLNNVETVTVERLVGLLRPPLEDRAVRDDLRLAIESPGDLGQVEVLASVSAVEQILFNLVDNACKYAQNAADRRIHLAVTVAGDDLAVLVRDHGPGIGPAARRRLFRAFSKSAHEAAESKPGVGLGLALSRQLARSMHGDVVLDTTIEDGAAFMLRLPRARGEHDCAAEALELPRRHARKR